MHAACLPSPPQGAFLRVTPALYPLPMISMGQLDNDWYQSITDKLKW